MLEALANLWYILLVLLGFGFVIFWHELGHFLAARWAKIRVHEFAVGFGPAVCAYRKGIGLRRGSTNTEYARMLKARALEIGATSEENLAYIPGVSQTEYRLNWFPLGGYVKMLGQEDANPGATSEAPDSYTQVAVWKRLIVISAGVIMNVILAAILFVVVYSVGLESNAPAVQVPTESVAHEAGMRTGDVVRSVNGNKVEVFQDLILRIGLSKKGAPLTIGVDRPGVDALEFNVVPEYDPRAEIRAIGVFAMPSTTIISPPEEDLARFETVCSEMGLEGLRPGATLVSVNGEAVTPVHTDPWGEVFLPTQILEAARASRGEPIELGFNSPVARETGPTFSLLPRPVLDRAKVALGEDDTIKVPHLLGMTGPLRVAATTDRSEKAGLRIGDLFAGIGSTDWPDFARAIRLIRAGAGSTIEARVLRDGAIIELQLPVTADGLVGFTPDAAIDDTLLATAPSGGLPVGDTNITPGERLVSVAGVPVGSIRDAYKPLIDATADALDAGEGATVSLRLASSEGQRDIAWTLDARTVEHLHTLGWSAEYALALFAPATVLQVGENPLDSVRLGLRETQRMLTRVYLTLGRLADGSVKPQQLKGPVGITHIGSRVAREGWIRLLFFIGLISANLAVLNFLPLPIVDGGHFLMLSYEGITKKPVPIAVQNALTIIGLILIAGVFLFVTTNDVLNLF